MTKVTGIDIGEVVERLDELRELPLEECLGEIADYARAEELDARFVGVIAMSDRMLKEFETALESASAEEIAGLAACLLVLLDDVVKNYLRFTRRVMAENDSGKQCQALPPPVLASQSAAVVRQCTSVTEFRTTPVEYGRPVAAHRAIDDGELIDSGAQRPL